MLSGVDIIAEVGLFRRPGWSAGVVEKEDTGAPGDGGGGIENRACSSSLASDEVDTGAAGRLLPPPIVMVCPGLRL